MIHLDLFSGIGGFALAASQVWGSDYHCVGFCEIDSFCQNVLRKNFEGVRIYGDIRGLTVERLAADTQCKQDNGERRDNQCGWNPLERREETAQRIHGKTDTDSVDRCDCTIDLLTGGFPCQPFSTAGKRKGTEDDRFLWPEMLRVIREVKPRFVIGENVAGIIEMALGQVCADLEGLDYEVQCFVIPACAVNAPHRRDRVWITARRVDTDSSREHGERPESIGNGCWQSEVQTGNGDCPSSYPVGEGTRSDGEEARDEGRRTCEGGRTSLRQRDGETGTSGIDATGADGLVVPARPRDGAEANPDSQGQSTEVGDERGILGKSADANAREGRSTITDPSVIGQSGQGQSKQSCDSAESGDGEATEPVNGRELRFPDWTRDWREVAALTCVHRVDDGLPRRVAVLPNGERISESKWRQEALKCYGNSIVPQVAMELMKCIKKINEWN